MHIKHKYIYFLSFYLSMWPEAISLVAGLIAVLVPEDISHDPGL